LVDKAYRGYFIGVHWPNLEIARVYVPELDKVLDSNDVIYDEVTKLVRKDDGLLIVDDKKKSIADFNYLVNMVYKDSDNNILYITTRVHVQRGFIVAFRAPLVDNKLGQEESRPVHAREVEIMLNDYNTFNDPSIYVFTRRFVLSRECCERGC
jgi:hypothetical protein